MPTLEMKEVSEVAGKKLENSELGKQLPPERPNMSKEEYDAPLAKKDVKEVGAPIQNKIDGGRREKEVGEQLAKKFPPSEGYSIMREQFLRNKDGSIAKDPLSGTARRIDFVVMKDGKVVDSIEVTSNTASKIGQTSKELRIREAGGNYVKGPDGKLVRVPNNIQTRIERRA